MTTGALITPLLMLSDVEVLYIAKRLGYRVKEVPIRWLDSKNSKVGLVKNPLKMIIELYKIRWIQGD